MLRIDGLDFTYPNGKGIKNISFAVGRGEVLGFLGPNGAGKTTTIRCLLGFLHGTGICEIDGKGSFDFATENMNNVGFIAGETAFPDLWTAEEYFNFIITVRSAGDKEKAAEMRTRKNELTKMFDLDFRGKIAKMSKGMKQKTAIISAFLHDPEILILDEPSSGLDPLMQVKFVELILEMKKMGKTILISSHIFDEVEKTCDRIVIIRDGEIVKVANIDEMREGQPRIFTITTKKGTERKTVAKKDIDKFIRKLSDGKDEILDIGVSVESLQDTFMTLYDNTNSKKPLDKQEMRAGRSLDNGGGAKK
jgi:ABC-2 type transport system ATP-binding protein